MIVLGAIPASAEVTLPERHPGLVTAAEGGYTPVSVERVSAEAFVDDCAGASR